MVKTSCLGLVSLMLLAACHTPPPRPWLRYELDGVTEVAQLGAGKFGSSAFGADVSIDLYNPDTRVLVVVDNPSDEALTVRLGPDAGAPQDAIGEVLLRQLSGPAAGGPPMRGYVAMNGCKVEAGWRATFYLDRPLGKDPKLGQYFVFAVEVENQKGERVRRFLPVVAKLGGTVPLK